MGGKNAKKSQQTGLDPSYCNPCNFFGLMSPFEVIRTLAGAGALGPFGGLIGGLGVGGCSPFGSGCSPFGNLGCSPFNGLGCAPFNNIGCGPFNGLGCGPFGGLGLGGLAPLAMPFGHFGGLQNLNGLGCGPFGSGFNGLPPFGAGCAPFNNIGCGPFNGLGCLPSLTGCAPGLGVGAPCNGIVPFRGSIAPLAMPWTNGPGCGFPAGFPGMLC